jgi:hypothetical protein
LLGLTSEQALTQQRVFLFKKPTRDCIFASICLSNSGSSGSLSGTKFMPWIYRIRPRNAALEPDEDGYARGQSRRASS